MLQARPEVAEPPNFTRPLRVCVEETKLENNELGHNELVLEHRATKYFLAAALELGLTAASIILNEREIALRSAIEPKAKKSTT